jgi:hypothetical protein
VSDTTGGDNSHAAKYKIKSLTKRETSNLFRVDLIIYSQTTHALASLPLLFSLQ